MPIPSAPARVHCEGKSSIARSDARKAATAYGYGSRASGSGVGMAGMILPFAPEPTPEIRT